jgi:hypothetical protein
MAMLGRNTVQSVSGSQCAITPHCGAFKNGVVLKGIAVTSICPARTQFRNCPRLCGGAVFHHS